MWKQYSSPNVHLYKTLILVMIFCGVFVFFFFAYVLLFLSCEKNCQRMEVCQLVLLRTLFWYYFEISYLPRWSYYQCSRMKRYYVSDINDLITTVVIRSPNLMAQSWKVKHEKTSSWSLITLWYFGKKYLARAKKLRIQLYACNSRIKYYSWLVTAIWIM